MNNAPKTETLLVKLLAQQHEARETTYLFKQGMFTLAWRAKVGSSPFPNLETIVSAAEPCGRFDWRSQQNASNFHYEQNPPIDETTEAVPEYFGNLSDLSQNCRRLKLKGYIPGSAIRGIVRAWAMQHRDLREEAIALLGQQENNSDRITPGKIVFLDAWAEETPLLSLDIVNPQQDFQVYHKPQGTTPQACNPQAIYTLGDGSQRLKFNVAIRGIPDQTRLEEEIARDVEKVWTWLCEALSLYGVGGRTASGYGALTAPRPPQTKPKPPKPAPGNICRRFEFELYSQGCYGVDKDDRNHPELRPSHWRGWLRSWALRFFLGVLPKEQAELALADLFGTIEPKARKGCVRIRMLRGKTWGDRSENSPFFYVWKGLLEINAPSEVLDTIILPIMRVAASVGGVGHGWRRPLHIFFMNNNKPAARGCFLKLRERGQDVDATGNGLLLPIDTDWDQVYQTWRIGAQNYLRKHRLQFFEPPDRLLEGAAEIFSPYTCAVYALPGAVVNPIDEQRLTWNLERNQVTVQTAEDTRGDGVWLIYKDRYKRNPEVGGNAGSGAASCSWVSIRRIDVPHQSADTDCQEIVCLFLGEQGTQGFNRDRYQFLKDLGKLDGSRHLFGVPAPTQR